MAIVILEGRSHIDVAAVAELLQQQGYVKLHLSDDCDINCGCFEHHNTEIYNVGKYVGVARMLVSLAIADPQRNYVIEHAHLAQALKCSSMFALGFLHVDNLLATTGIKLVHIAKDESMRGAVIQLADSDHQQLSWLYARSVMRKTLYYIDTEPITVLTKWLGEDCHGQK